MANDRKLPPGVVYTTGVGRTCPECGAALAACECAARRAAAADAATAPNAAAPRVIRMRRETQGRRGKTVTVLVDVALPERELDLLLAALKQKCGAGGTRAGRDLELQGDQRDKLEAELVRRGFSVKRVGG